MLDKPTLRQPAAMAFPQFLQEERPDFAYSATTLGGGAIGEREAKARGTRRARALAARKGRVEILGLLARMERWRVEIGLLARIERWGRRKSMEKGKRLLGFCSHISPRKRGRTVNGVQFHAILRLLDALLAGKIEWAGMAMPRSEQSHAGFSYRGR